MTQKTGQALSDGISLAKEEGHQQLVPLHLAVVLWEDPEGGLWR